MNSVALTVLTRTSHLVFTVSVFLFCVCYLSTMLTNPHIVGLIKKIRIFTIIQLIFESIIPPYSLFGHKKLTLPLFSASALHIFFCHLSAAQSLSVDHVI